MAEQWIWSLDGWIILAGVLCAVASSLVGNFLVLRRMSLLGDAISHAVLPGLAVAFFISGSRSSWIMFLGAVLVGIVTALLTQWIRSYGNVDEGASMGVVFTTLFALGLVLIVQAADSVDLDAGCVLYGAIELTPLDTWNLAGWDIPQVVVILSIVCTINLLFVVVCFKELTITSFDPSLATTSGFNANLVHYVLMTLVAITAVASFESVGNILVIAMMIVPPATALLLSDRLATVIGWSALLGALAAVLGHVSAITIPGWFGLRSTSTSGMMACATGLFFVLAAMFAPKNGAVVRLFRRRILTWRILAEDVLAALYRHEEHGEASVKAKKLSDDLYCDPKMLAKVGKWQERQGLLLRSDDRWSLTSAGRAAGQQLVRTHRLWEHYLVEKGGFEIDRIHAQAERLEHFTDDLMRDQLTQAGDSPKLDPHGRQIPGSPP